MNRTLRKTTRLFVDLGVLSLALWAAYLIRFDSDLPPLMLRQLVFIWPYVVGLQYFCVIMVGAHRFAWRYIGLRETLHFLRALVLANALLLMLRLLAAVFQNSFVLANYVLVPIGVILIDLFLSFLALNGVRIALRLFSERSEHNLRDAHQEKIPTMLIGAGQAGVMVAKEIAGRPDLGIEAVGFLDDDKDKIGTVIHGVQVLGSIEQLRDLAYQRGAKQVLITLANAPGQTIRRIRTTCETAGLPAKIIPGIYEIIDGQVNLSRIRPVAIEDLLGRKPADLDVSAIRQFVTGAKVLITGAAGSIGSELCRQIARFSPAALILVDQWENGLFSIDRELRQHYPELAILPEIADICDRSRMQQLFQNYAPPVVFHAAAYKHVPMMELHPAEAVKNNVHGTRQLADLAATSGVSHFVLISTDKAVNPSSAMGATKRLAEMYVQALAQDSQTRFITVRFGNVLGSAGSVVPIFQEQIAKGGPVTVTDPNMRRYFMTIPEACQLVLQATSMGNGGEIFVLDMGEPVRIIDLATDLIRLSGLKPDEDIEIRITGRRPGEKLFEEIAVEDEHATKTRHPQIYVGNCKVYAAHDIAERIDGLLAILQDSGDLLGRLRACVPEYLPEGTLAANPEKSASAIAEKQDPLLLTRVAARSGRAV